MKIFFAFDCSTLVLKWFDFIMVHYVSNRTVSCYIFVSINLVLNWFGYLPVIFLIYIRHYLGMET